jgi:hypothetical protein
MNLHIWPGPSRVAAAQDFAMLRTSARLENRQGPAHHWRSFVRSTCDSGGPRAAAGGHSWTTAVCGDSHRKLALTWENAGKQGVGRGGIEPPTFRFSGTGSAVHGASAVAPMLVSALTAIPATPGTGVN